MNVTVIPADQLSPEQVWAWATLHSADPSSDSPFFRPEFTQAVAAVRKDVEVAVLEENGQPVGFFPFQRRHGNVGRPIGGPMADFNGPILRPGLAVDARELIESCGLSAWHFDCLVAAKTAFRPYFWFLDGSPYIDTSRGFDAYWASRRQAGSATLRKTFQKLRKLEREVGDVRIKFATRKEQVLRKLIEWKGAQCRKARVFNVFSPEWTGQLLRNLLERNAVEFSGIMSALYVRDELQAVFFCLRSNYVLHLWIAAYGPKLAKYSPGYQLLTKMVQAAHGLGIERIDLGRGTERFKASFATGAIPLAEGSVDVRPARRTLRWLWHRSRHQIGQSALRKPVAAPWRLLKRVRDKAHYR